MEKVFINLFLFVFIFFSYNPVFPQYFHESLSLFNNLLPSLKDSEKIAIGMHTYTNFNDRLSEPKSLNDYNLVSRFRIKKEKKFFSHFEFGCSLRSFIAFRCSPNDTTINSGNITVNIKPDNTFGGTILSPACMVLSDFRIAKEAKVYIGYLHRHNFISDNMNLSSRYKSGHDFSVVLKTNKVTFQTFWRSRLISNCVNLRDSITRRNYTLPGEFRNMFLATITFSDSLDRNIFFKQYVSVFFSNLTKYKNLLATDSTYTNSFVCGMVIYYHHLIINPEYNMDFLQWHNANNPVARYKFMSFSLLAGYRFKNFLPKVRFSRTHYFYPVTNVQTLTSDDDRNYFLINFGLEYI
ncbi:MAG: hypothetical protein V1904_06515 [Bacteroidota bacterium]